MAARPVLGSALGVAVMAAASGLLVGGLVTAITRPGDLLAWFAALETPEGWSAHPIVIVPIILFALVVAIAGERFLNRLIEPVRRDDDEHAGEPFIVGGRRVGVAFPDGSIAFDPGIRVEPIVGDAGPGRYPAGTGWDATERDEGFTA